MTNQQYPTDLTDAQWQILEPFFRKRFQRGRKGLPEFVKSTLGFAIEIVKRPRGSHSFEVLPKRWIVERTFAWLGFCRRHSKDYERNPQTSEAMIYISMIHLMLKRLAPAKL